MSTGVPLIVMVPTLVPEFRVLSKLTESADSVIPASFDFSAFVKSLELSPFPLSVLTFPPSKVVISALVWCHWLVNVFKWLYKVSRLIIYSRPIKFCIVMSSRSMKSKESALAFNSSSVSDFLYVSSLV